MNAGEYLSGGALLLYFLASVAYQAHLFAGGTRTRLAALAALIVVVAVHTAAIGYRCTHESWLFNNPGAVASLSAYFLAIAQLALDLSLRWRATGAVALPVAFVAEFYALLRTPNSIVQPRALPSEALNPHVLATILGFAAFAIAFSLAVLYLIQSRMLKRKRLGDVFRRLPPLTSIGRGAHWFAIAGLSMLTLGILTGALAAWQLWASNWYLDPKVLTTGLAWLVYAAYLLGNLRGWQGRKSTYYLIAGFVVVLIAYFGISMLAPGRQHPL